MTFVSTRSFELETKTLADVIAESDARGVRNQYHDYGALVDWRRPTIFPDPRTGEKDVDPNATVLSKEVQLDIRLRIAEQFRTRDTHLMEQLLLPLPAE